MTDRDRLITKIMSLNKPTISLQTAMDIVDAIIDEGVIVPPCKVGDRYVIDTAKNIFNAWNDVTGALVEGTSWYYELESVIEDIVKLSFGAGVLFREEAEAKLKERDTQWK
jgi:hypothetical protein